MTTNEIGFTLSVKSEQFVRAMREVEESRKRVDRVFAQGASKQNDPLSLARFQQAKTELRAVSREYEAIKRSMDAQAAAGKQIADTERARLRTLEAQKRLVESEVSRSKWSKTDQLSGGGTIQDVKVSTVDNAGRFGMLRRGLGAAWTGMGHLNQGSRWMSGMAGGAAQFALGNPAAMVTALSSLPFLGPGLGMVAASALQQYAMGKPILMQNLQSASMARALTGMGGGYLRGAGNFGLSLAFSRAQSLQMLGGYSQAAGGVEGFQTSLRMQRGYGVETGDLVSSARQMSLETAKSVQLALVRGIESGAFNRALAREFSQASGSLMTQIAGAGGTGSANNISALVSLMAQRLGGIYERSPSRVAGVLGGVNNALQGFASGQGDEAKQAFMFDALRSANPKLSYVQLLRQAERGVSDPRNLSAILKLVRRRYANPEQQALAFSRLTGRSVTEGFDVMGMQGISSEEVAHRLKTGAPEKQLAARTKEGMKGLGIVQRDLYLGEKRAALAATMDPMMARYNDLQMQAVGLLGKVVDKLQELLGFTSKKQAEENRQRAATSLSASGTAGGAALISGDAWDILRSGKPVERGAKPNLPAPVGGK